MSKKVLSRRTVLRGAIGGVSAMVGLPILEAMLGSHGEVIAGPNPLKFIMWFWGNGMVPYRWDPQTQGPGWTSESTAPLDVDPAVKQYVSILTQFDSKAPQKITHHEGMCVFNGYPFQYSGGLSSFAGGPTIDQLIATKLEGSSTVKSIQLGVSSKLSYMDGGTTMFVLSHAQAGPQGALTPKFNPQQVWTDIFGSFVPPDDASGPLRVKVLDAVKDQTASLRTRLGTTDKERLDQHLEGISELQKKIEALPPACTVPMMPTETNQAVPEHLDETTDAMHELIVYALSCNITPVASLMMHGGAAATAFSNLGQNGIEHHLDNTHQQMSGWENRYVDVVKWHMGKLQKLLARMYATPDGPGTNLLDNSILFASSDCSSGWDHSVDNQPMLIAGKGGGQLAHPGVHIAGGGGNPTDALLSILQCYDASATSVGGGATMSSSPLAGIKAG